MATSHCKQWHNPSYLQHSIFSLLISYQTWQQLFEVGIMFCIQNIWNRGKPRFTEEPVPWTQPRLSALPGCCISSSASQTGVCFSRFWLTRFMRDEWLPGGQNPKLPRGCCKENSVFYFLKHTDFSRGRRWFRILLLLYLQFTKSGLKSTASATTFRLLLPFSCYINIQGKKNPYWIILLGG